MKCASAPSHNQILAIARPSGAPPCPKGFVDVTANPQGARPGALRVYVTPQTTLQINSDDEAGIHIYLWGLAGHPELERSAVPRWIAGQLTGAGACKLRQIVGSYIALLDDRRNSRVHIVSDVVGTRPFFAGVRGESLVCGSDVLAMARAGWIGRSLNYDAIAAWVRAGYDFTEGSLFDDVSLIEPGAVTTLADNRLNESSYVAFSGGCDRPPLGQYLDNIHEAMTRAFATATRELGRCQIALSGGFDSRYLAAMAAENRLDVRAACLGDSPAEAEVSREVAHRLNLPLRMIETDGSRWNVYDEPFHFAPSGFPITKQQTYPAARVYPGLPCLNGFMGDGIIRGTVDRLEDKLPSETSEDHARVFQRAQKQKHTFARFDLVENDILKRCDKRTLPACQSHVARYAHTSNVFAAAMYLRRHRTYFGNNFVQHLSFAEAILPFANYDLLAIKCRTHPDYFSWENYQALLTRFYPGLADIPHNQKKAVKYRPPHRPSAVTPRWAGVVLLGMLTENRLKLLNPRRTLPRLLGALVGGEKADVVALFTYRLYLLEQQLREFDIELDWDAI